MHCIIGRDTELNILAEAGPQSSNAGAWGTAGIMKYLSENRTTTKHVYESEWHFLKGLMKEEMSILYVGCAQGGFVNIFREHLDSFSYTGIDINEDMIRQARDQYPAQTFHHAWEGDFSAVAGQRYDLVLVLGILHLHETWRETLAAAWQCTGQDILFDLRETKQETLQDKKLSYFRPPVYDGTDVSDAPTLPYSVINESEANSIILDICGAAAKTDKYGYTHPVSAFASCPYEKVIMRTWKVSR